jgi:hypothetical protein
MGVDGVSATDEDSMSKAMRRKAMANLDSPGMSGCKKSFLNFSTPTIVAHLDSLGVSLGSSVEDINVSSKALKRMEYDRIKCTPNVSRPPVSSAIEVDEDAYAISDGQLLNHLIGEVSEVGLEETLPFSVDDLTASNRKSKSASRKLARPGKKARFSKSNSGSK